MLNAALHNSSQDFLRQINCFSNRPDLVITPVVVPSKSLWNSKTNSANAQLRSHKSKPKQSKEEMDINHLLLQLPALGEYFELHKKIGEGTYSSVYLATYKFSNERVKFAIKHLTQNFSISRINKELKFMQLIGGEDNVISVLHCLKSSSDDCVVFVMPYLEHRRFSEYVLDMDAEELRLYMKNLFIALRRVHAFNVIHRDVKPGNFLYNRHTKKFLLVDFGLAQQVESSCKEDKKVSPIMPLDYSKRRRSDPDEGTPMAKLTAFSPLKSRENIMNESGKRMVDVTPPLAPHFPSAEHRLGRTSVEKTPAKFKGPSSSSSKSSSSRKKLFTDTSLTSSLSSRSHRRETSLGTSLLKLKTESLLATSPSESRSFTPLVSTKTPSSFVQVRNSQVVAQRQKKCDCSGSGVICSPCQGKRVLAAPRAGTPGFRPPEVLLKYFHQTTAVDMWAAGVVMLCILSGSYPFFKAPTDLAALAEIMSIFGNESLSRVAAKFGRRVVTSGVKKPIDLRQMCRRLRARRPKSSSLLKPQQSIKCEECGYSITDIGCVCIKEEIEPDNRCSNNDIFPDSAYHLLLRLLDLDPATRITAEEALSHPFITQE